MLKLWRNVCTIARPNSAKLYSVINATLVVVAACLITRFPWEQRDWKDLIFFQIGTFHRKPTYLSLHDFSLRSLSIEQRNCRFPDEAEDLKMHKNYSQSNCLFECSYFYAREKTGQLSNLTCSPWFFPFPDDSIEKCNPQKSYFFLTLMTDDIPDEMCSHCVPDCIRTIYESSISSVPFRWGFICCWFFWHVMSK